MPRVHALMTVDEVLRKWPAAADVFNRHGIDTCCGGDFALDQAAAAAGADLAAVLRDLERAAAESTPAR